jgi:hypothetical protein
MMTPSEMSDVLRIAIADALKEAGHDGLAAAAEEIAKWVTIVGPHVMVARIAAEPMPQGSATYRGEDGLIRPATRPTFPTFVRTTLEALMRSPSVDPGAITAMLDSHNRLTRQLMADLMETPAEDANYET